MDESPGVCTVDGCDQDVVARGWCRRHYARWQRTGNVEARSWKPQGNCSVDGCDRKSSSGGLCDMHRWRVRTSGDPGPAGPIKRGRPASPKGPCAVEGCGRLRKAGAPYCHLHRERVRLTGEVGPAQPMRVKGRVSPNSDGYIRVHTENGRRVMEHVHVMEQYLGRRLAPGENVHHRNGIKHDNEIGNLELWLVVQPTGQRVADLMTYIATYHADAMRALLAGEEVDLP